MVSYVSRSNRKRSVIQIKSYIKKWLKSQILQLHTQHNGWKKLIEKYNDHVFFAEMKGKSWRTWLKKLRWFNCESWYDKRENNLQKESERITITAAKLILSDIRSMSLESDIYSTENETSDIKTCERWSPESLRKFLEVLIKIRLKRSAVGRVLIMGCR